MLFRCFINVLKQQQQSRISFVEAATKQNELSDDSTIIVYIHIAYPRSSDFAPKLH